jgi:hypothetical protein
VNEKFNMFVDSRNKKLNKFSNLEGTWTEDPEQIEEYISLLEGEEKKLAVKRFISEEFWGLYGVK